jgi:hypothetical protein
MLSLRTSKRLTKVNIAPLRETQEIQEMTGDDKGACKGACKISNLSLLRSKKSTRTGKISRVGLTVSMVAASVLQE